MAFKKGQSGNPTGRKKGIGDKRSALRAMLVPHQADIIATVVTMAKAGDATAMRLVMERLLPPIRATDEPLAVPLNTSGNKAEVAHAIFDGAARGEISLDTARGLLDALQSVVGIVELEDIRQRLEVLETGKR